MEQYDAIENNRRIVLITGAAGGIGTLLVERFLAHGDTVLATDMNQDRLDQWREGFNQKANLSTIAADISTEEGAALIAKKAQELYGYIDVLINGAGYFPIVPFENMSAAEWRRIVDINLTGYFLVTHAVLPLMKNRGWGRIINFGSGSVFDGTPGQAHYVAAKAGVVGFSRSLSREVGQYNITVNVIAPGLTVTKAVRDSFPEAILQTQRLRRAIQRDELPEDLVGPVFFLASPDAGFITGQTINVDGGVFMT